jgi:competence protein ComEA
MQQFGALAKYKLWIAGIAFAAGAILLAQHWMARTNTTTAVVSPLEETAFEPALEYESEGLDDLIATSAPPEMVIVYVSGAVRAPDVYQLPAQARIKDLVLAAGGLASDADPERINLAGRLKDGDHIHVPSQGEARAESGDGGTADATDAEDTLIDLNTAGAAELDGLPGIGQALAQRIVEYRAASGPFGAVEDLRNVKGIGPALFAQIAPLVSVGP